MKRQKIYIPKYDWEVHVFYDTTIYNADEILNELHKFGCSKKGISKTLGQFLTSSYNNGFTYSNKSIRVSLVSLGRASSFSQFLNSFVHEVHHLSTHIADAENISLVGEEICYLSGKIAQMMYPVLIHYISKCKL